MLLKELRQTCEACPSQWEGTTEDERPIYVRYRWGHLSIRIGNPGESIEAAVGGAELVSEQLGDELDGYIDEDKVLRIIAGIEVPAGAILNGGG